MDIKFILYNTYYLEIDIHILYILEGAINILL